MAATPRPASGGPRLLALAVPLGALCALVAGLLSIALVFGAAAPEGCATAGGAPAALGEVDGVPVPARLKPIYAEAARRWRLGPRGPSILASVNWNESAFGTNMGDPPGAMGWMSFLPESWASFGVDGDGDGDRDPYDPADAIPAAARLLRLAGAPGDWQGALYSYNHSAEYVADVLGEAREIAGSARPVGAGDAGTECVLAAAPNELVATMVAEADRLSRLRPRTEYVWGGSHGESPISPDSLDFDCSSAVSFILQRAGLGNPTMDTVAFSTWGEPGPGRWVTLHDKPYGADAHIFIEFAASVTPPAERYWGTSGIVAPGHGPGWIPESAFGAGYLSGFELRHPPGL